MATALCKKGGSADTLCSNIEEALIDTLTGGRGAMIILITQGEVGGPILGKS